MAKNVFLMVLFVIFFTCYAGSFPSLYIFRRCDRDLSLEKNNILFTKNNLIATTLTNEMMQCNR